jgi:hypothetical protein
VSAVRQRSHRPARRLDATARFYNERQACRCRASAVSAKEESMKRALLVAAAGLALAMGSTHGRAVLSNDRHDDDGDEARIHRGFAITPVPLNLHHRNRELVGLGSYIVNAQAACNDCHSCPSFAHGGNPYVGQPTKINALNYLAGGVAFGPFLSHNITPDADGKPFGLSLGQFKQVMRTGHDPKDPPDDILQVMPWPVYGNMTDHDLKAVYEFLRSIPPAQPGSCPNGPGDSAP